jgi:hypothetical protein
MLNRDGPMCPVAWLDNIPDASLRPRLERWGGEAIDGPRWPVARVDDSLTALAP